MLLKAFREGQPEAITEVFQTYVHDISSFLQRGFVFSSSGRSCRFEGYRDSFELQDAVQEIFVKAFSERARMQYDGLRSYKSYLLGIAKNFVIDEYRKVESKMRWYRLEDSEATVNEASEWSGSKPETEARLESDELADLIQGFVASLGCDERKVFDARFTRGLSQRNAAEDVGITRMKLRLVEYRIRSKALKFFKNTGYLPNGLQMDDSTLGLLFLCLGCGR